MQHGENVAGRGAKSGAPAQPQPAALQALGQHRLRAHAASSGSWVTSATSRARSPPGDGPRTTRPTFGLTARRTGAIAADDATARTSQVVIATTRSAHSNAALAAAVARRGRSQITMTPPRRPASRIDSTGPASISWHDLVPGQDADAAVVGKRVAHRGPAQPAALQAEVRPTQSRRGLTVQEQVDAAGPGVQVDQQRGAGGLGQRRGEDRCAGPAATTDDCDHPPVAGTSRACSSGIGEVAGQQVLLRRERAHVLGTNGYRGLPGRLAGLTAAHQDQPGPARHPLAAAGGRLVEDHRRHRRPGLSGQHCGRTPPPAVPPPPPLARRPRATRRRRRAWSARCWTSPDPP